ncbi:aquaporin-like [Schistocerca gregaria]|uniref:aquaporin-like n=1 Tax=Schistocerca gregaria TaxID=7010 RepID=UPI00211DCF9C|nr:aquaporin-like [Schistocerca gregaria]XP_049838367.1 aquaporin-like [Schistocerca gregaria]XP_049838370.1 aquaporin-like [Schistocerca gregaria]XP_049838371.1 aquaporin-like [Schistocerca gregaria]XP_049838372.1 aquaporin-like [Schistocerca gregaria]XP_049838373.1 aquaporin-like [Schistocerca gregaria]XP_049838374.1 aquaporin-like [Schistocerca gregaria]XP_049838375.1 aquaporin-like [Schistocerca gregaria]XP_049838376.1 aquaporin-like [Schistocerca gregaria]XP_049838377.1 aquaporin-like
MPNGELGKMTPDITVVHCAPDVANGKTPPVGEKKTPVEPCCLAAVKGVMAAFRRHPETGSVFGKLSARRMLVVFCAELLGTALLMFVGCMGGVYGLDGTSEKPSGLQGPLVFGMTVATIIQIVGHISVAHLNPSVTLCAVLRGDLNVAAALVYLVAEGVGAVLGFGLLLVATPASVACECTTVPAAPLTPLQALLVETVATAVLVLLCMGLWDGRNSRNTDSSPLKFGFYITIISLAAGPYTGASMNPVRTLAPALWKNVWTDHWIYWVGPLSGSAVATLLYQLVFEERPSEVASKNSDNSVGCCAGGSTDADDSVVTESHRF